MKKIRLILTGLVLVVMLAVSFPQITKADTFDPGGPQDTSKARKGPETPLDPATVFAILRMIVFRW
jgi:hypothetical protein